MVPELIGRFPVHVPFHSLNEELLVRIMQEPKNSIISQAKQLFALDKIRLHFTDGALREIARVAVQKKTGARALRSIIESVLLDAKYEVPGAGVDAVIIDENAVKGKSPYVCVRKRTSNALKQNIQCGEVSVALTPLGARNMGTEPPPI
ncbi:unnamed protein product [Toxocara canis]|uniref:ClpB_D2-small domain-containing protein n=1 Tax=Toxocara canis TaxID=6265 RepID=A0A183U2L2_TOXCA|nr:unnamed protein product [Toxocara canis]